MSMQDPIADMFTRIRNGQMASKFLLQCLLQSNVLQLQTC